MGKRRILVLYPHLTAYGGGQGVVAWALQALRDEHDVTLLSWLPPDLDAVNRFYGTSLAAGDFAVEIALPRLPEAARNPVALARLHLWGLAAVARRMRGFDLRFAIDEETDLGGAGVQYVHFPRAYYLTPAKMRQRRWWHAAAIRGYYAAIRVLTGTRPARIAANTTVVNSDWTGRLVTELLGVDTVTVHPPAAGSFAPVAWGERQGGFVAVGRLSWEKRYPLLVEIVEHVRAAGHAVGLTIVGGVGDRATVGELARLAADRPWLTIARNLSREALAQLLSTTRYGLHGMREEHFGMAIAEMVRAGQIPFVPNRGGQVEIVGDDRLVWSDAGDAAAKILRVLGDPALQAELRGRLAERSDDLGPERFVREIKAVTRRALISAAGK